MPFTTGGQNIGTQFGLPLFGVTGILPPFTGNSFWVDPTNGSDGGTGGPQDPLATLTQALTMATAGNNDVIYLNGTYKPTATLVWNKANTHLVGLGQGHWPTSIITVANTAATSGAFSPLVSVTAAGCIFYNVYAISGIAQASTQVCWAEAGGNNAYINCNFNQVGNATAAAQAGNRALTVASLNNTFLNCVIGGDAIVRATGTNSSLATLTGSGSCIFTSCVFPMWSSVAASTFILAATTTAAGYMLFDDCTFINDTSNAGGTSLTQAFSVSATAGANFIMTPSTVVAGATILNTGSTGTIFTSNSAAAATGNKVITAT